MKLIIGEEYDYFDDGKISVSRRRTVKILDIVLFENIDKDILHQWETEVEDCPWLYNRETDFFIKAYFVDTPSEIIYFVRTTDLGWFSLGFWAGRLFEKSFWKNKLKEMKE